MIAGDVIPALARPWFAEQRTSRLRAVVPIVSLAFAWWVASASLTPLAWIVVGLYAAAHLGLLAARHYRLSMPTARIATGIDLLLVLLVASGALVLGSSAVPITALVGLRTIARWRTLTLVSATPLVALLAFLLAMFLGEYFPALAGLPTTLQLWALTTGLGLCTIAVLSNTRQQHEIAELRLALRAERNSREARVDELERTASELRTRMREQHALEEGLRVITSSLSLDEVLHQIVDSTVQTLGRDRIAGMDLSLLVEGQLTHHAYTRDDSDSEPWASALARRAMQQGAPLIISDATHHDEFAAFGHRLRSAISVPLFVGDGPARGALTVISAEAATFSSSHARHLAAFATQAGIAIGNAELHSRMREQQRLLEAVVRDINDGLIVVDDTGEIVLTNPIGGQLLDATTEATTVRERLMELAARARKSDQATVVAELKLKHEDEDEEAPEILSSERFYQAFASRIQRDTDGRLVAIVLHDITHHRAEERARTEFISMVSHELRNPLHSLNGFLKVVTQGRAGALNELQQDFLQMADEQVELLKGRISELLEFNRMKAGRLTLKPQINDMSLLVAGTVNRLGFQAEQTGLTLINQVQPDLPECMFDGERIGQVLTNLIENAIKATPSGGTISVSSQIHEQELWVAVRDTGVGIAPGDLGKIFQRFYRAHNQKSIYGSHLGLGLAICQQIVEGHGGRIWVESELNVGSVFTFALPLVAEAVSVELR